MPGALCVCTHGPRVYCGLGHTGHRPACADRAQQNATRAQAPRGGGDALDRTRRCAEERSGVHTETALQPAPGEPVWPAWLPLSGEALVDS
jgi:hypothetical protein